jgi:hypothetical protein
MEAALQWIVLVVRLPAGPSQHRVAVWRELRKAGALSLGQGIWAAPQVAAFAEAVTRAVELAEGAGGDAIVLRSEGRGPADAARLEAMFTAAREQEWAELRADCGKYEAELDKEIRTAKFTLAELEEEEQSLGRLRRWHRDLKARDVFGSPGAEAAEEHLERCAGRFEEYSERVFAALHAFGPDTETLGTEAGAP